MNDHLTRHAAAKAVAADARIDAQGQTVMTAAPNLAADIDRWNIETLELLNEIGNLFLGPAGYCSVNMYHIKSTARRLADDRRRIEAVLAERSKG